jgi:ubiquinol-cytochrome c reductase cytochrome c1 subunit
MSRWKCWTGRSHENKRNQKILAEQVMKHLISIRGSRLLLLVLATGLLGVFCPRASASLKTTQAPLKQIKIDLNNKPALRNGALYTLHVCTACHSLRAVRYSSLSQMLGMKKSEFMHDIGTNGRHFHDLITSNMPPAIIHAFVGTTPPDLTDIARRHSPAWLYTYLTSYYVDPSRPSGVNNAVFHNTSMPDVFAPYQGLQKPVMVKGLRYGSPAEVAIGVKPLSQGSMTQAQFDRTARDIVNFLYAVAHPHQQERERLGPWFLGLFVLLSLLTYLIYRIYWGRVITSKERWWRSVK